MFRLLAAALPLLAAAPGAPVPKDKPCPYYAAVKAGDRREYRGPDGRVTHTLLVTKVEKAPGGGLLVTEALAGGDAVTPFRVLAVTGDAVAIDGGPAGPAHVVVRPGLAAGATWEYREPGGADVWRYTARGAERVTVPAGTFDAVRVDVELSLAGLTAWYAPGVGEVKCVTREWRGPPGGKGDDRVLHAFTPGK